MPVLSSRTAALHASPIREILAVIDRPGMVSFAGGLPSPDSFPAIDSGLVPAGVLQYGPTEGEPAPKLREGALALNDPAEARGYLAVFQVGRGAQNSDIEN